MWKNFNEANSLFKGNTEEFYKEYKKLLASKEAGFEYKKAISLLEFDLSPFFKRVKNY